MASIDNSKWTDLRNYLRVFPFVVAVVALVFISQNYSVMEILAEIQREETIYLIPLALGTLLLLWWFVALADYWAIRGFASPGFFDVMFARAACVIFEIASYAVGRGGYAFWLNRRYALSGSLTAGIIIYIAALEFGAMACIVSLVNVLNPVAPVGIAQLAILATVLLSFLIISAPWKLIGEPFQFVYPWTRHSRRKSFFLLGLKIVQLFLFIAASGVAAHLFGLDLPWPVVFSYFPLIFVIAALPINVAGFGAVQGAWLLLEPWADGERILAFSVVWGLALTMAAILRGLPFIGRLTGDLMQFETGRSDKSP